MTRRIVDDVMKKDRQFGRERVLEFRPQCIEALQHGNDMPHAVIVPIAARVLSEQIVADFFRLGTIQPNVGGECLPPADKRTGRVVTHRSSPRSSFKSRPSLHRMICLRLKRIRLQSSLLSRWADRTVAELE